MQNSVTYFQAFRVPEITRDQSFHQDPDFWKNIKNSPSYIDFSEVTFWLMKIFGLKIINIEIINIFVIEIINIENRKLKTLIITMLISFNPEIFIAQKVASLKSM